MNAFVPESLKEPISGCFAGVVGTALGFPLDTMKTRMQTTKMPLFQTCRHIYQENGLGGFYRGITAPLISLTILNTLNFSSYSNMKTKFSTIFGNSIFPSVPLASSCVGPLASMISTPFELIKIQLQLDVKSSSVRKYNGSLATAFSILREFGPRGLYVGHVVNTVREIVFLSVYFTTYETIRQISAVHSSLPDIVAIPLAGGFSGSIGWFISFPLDCIKANIQSRPLIESLGPGSKKGALQTGRELFKSKGIFGFYNGLAPSVIRAFIVSSSRFSAYEFAKWVLE